MSLQMTRRTYAEFRKLRRRYASGRIVGPHWLVLGSDVLSAALDLADIARRDVRNKLARSNDCAELGRRSPLFAKLLPQLPTCTFIAIKSGVVMIRRDGRFTYREDGGRAKMVIWGMNLPETAIVASKGRRLSEIVDISMLPAIAKVDPIVRSAKNEMHERSGTNHRVVVNLVVGWHGFAPARVGIERSVIGGSCMSSAWSNDHADPMFVR